MQLVLAGHPTAAIAERLGITVGTAKNHRRRIYEKLDITTERELFLQFFRLRKSADRLDERRANICRTLAIMPPELFGCAVW